MTKKPKTASPTALGEPLEALALSLASDLRSSETPMDERISGFKALTTYFAMINKVPLPDDEGKGGFSGYKDTIRGLGQGKPRSAAAGSPNGTSEF